MPVGPVKLMRLGKDHELEKKYHLFGFVRKKKESLLQVRMELNGTVKMDL